MHWPKHAHDSRVHLRTYLCLWNHGSVCARALLKTHNSVHCSWGWEEVVSCVPPAHPLLQIDRGQSHQGVEDVCTYKSREGSQTAYCTYTYERFKSDNVLNKRKCQIKRHTKHEKVQSNNTLYIREGEVEKHTKHLSVSMQLQRGTHPWRVEDWRGLMLQCAFFQISEYINVHTHIEWGADKHSCCSARSLTFTHVLSHT